MYIWGLQNGPKCFVVFGQSTPWCGARCCFDWNANIKIYMSISCCSSLNREPSALRMLNFGNHNKSQMILFLLLLFEIGQLEKGKLSAVESKRYRPWAHSHHQKERFIVSCVEGLARVSLSMKIDKFIWVLILSILLTRFLKVWLFVRNTVLVSRYSNRLSQLWLRQSRASPLFFLC